MIEFVSTFRNLPRVLAVRIRSHHRRTGLWEQPFSDCVARWFQQPAISQHQSCSDSWGNRLGSPQFRRLCFWEMTSFAPMVALLELKIWCWRLELAVVAGAGTRRLRHALIALRKGFNDKHLIELFVGVQIVQIIWFELCCLACGLNFGWHLDALSECF